MLGARWYVGTMCGRYVSGSDELTWREWVDILRPPPPGGAGGASTDSAPPPERPAQPGSEVVAFVASGVTPARWGFVMPAGRGLYFNLRGETAPKRFAPALRERRAALPAVSFEVSAGEKGQKKRPRFRVRADRPLLLAALWSPDPTGGLPRVSILTRASQGKLEKLHDREPILLPTELLAAWVGAGDGAALLEKLLERPDPTLTLEAV